MLNRDSYIHISAFMVTELGLKGNELLVYAIIYGFSQDGESEYIGGISYLCEWLGASKPTVINALKSLTAKGLIVKFENNVSRRKNSYKAIQPLTEKGDTGENSSAKENEKKDIEENFSTRENTSAKETDKRGKEILPNKVKKFNLIGKKTLPDEVKKFNPEGKEILPNNKNNNIYINNIYTRGDKKHSPPSFEDIKKYAEQIDALIDPDTFYEHYQSRNWKVNGSVIDWKAKFRRWNREEKAKMKEPGGARHYAKEPSGARGKNTMALQRPETSTSMNELERTLLSRQM